MVAILNLSPTFQIVQEERRVFELEVEMRVEELWQAALSTMSSRLFNGPIFCATDYNEREIRGYFSEYRYLMAQIMDPRLKTVLNMKPVSLLGFLTCRDGVLFGRRQSWVATRPGQWGFLPSGLLRPDLFANQGKVDYVKAFLIHLKEELNMEAHFLSDLSVHSLVVDKAVEGENLSLVMRADIALSSLSVKKEHLNAPDDEYDEVIAVPPEGLDAFLADKSNRDMGIAGALLARESYLSLESDCA